MLSAEEPRLTRFYEDLFMLQHTDPLTRQFGRANNSYAVLSGGEAVYVDAPYREILPLVERVSGEGHAPSALVLTHRHVAAQADALEVFQQEYGVPVFLHPIDARHPQAAITGFTFEDPTGSELLARFDLEVRLFPGHTEGHVIVRWNRHGGVLLTGDATMGTSAGEYEDGIERLVRPPIAFNVDDEGIRRQWIEFDERNESITGVAPFHGNAFIDREGSIREIMRPLQRPEPTLGPTG